MDLNRIKEKVEKGAKERGMSIINIDGDSIREKFYLDKSKGYEDFLDNANNLGCSFIMMNAGKIDDDYFYCLAPETHEEFSSELKDEIHNLKEKWRDMRGSFFVLGLYFIKDGCCFSMDIFNEDKKKIEMDQDFINLFERYLGNKRKYKVCSRCGEETNWLLMSDEDSSKDFYCNSCQEKVRQEQEEYLEKLTDKLSEDQEFIKLKNNEMRRIYLKKHYPEAPIERVARIASMVKAKRKFKENNS